MLLVEGEKAADAAQDLFPDLVVVTSPGGSNAAGKADWSPLRGLPVIICTGYSERVDAYKARELGAKDFVLKPLRMRDLAVLVRRVLDEDDPPAG